MFVDTHCHLHDPRFDEDRAEAINRAREAGVQAMIAIGCDLETTQKAQSLALIHEDIYFSAGFHPHEAKLAGTDVAALLKPFATHPRCVAIGECGLDYYYDHSPRDVQMAVFTQQANLAADLQKPLVVHVREAFDDCLTILDSISNLKTVVIHCFTGSLSVAQQMIERGYYLSIPGIVTFKAPGQLLEVVAQMPLDRLLIETDSPYLAPLPYRGKRNEPAYVVKVAEKIAEARSIALEEAAAALTTNSKRVFRI